jgi:hypothetical protein
MLDNWGLGRVRHGDGQGRGVDSTNSSADEWDNGVSNACCAYQDATIPAIKTVIASASEDVQRCRNIQWSWKLYRKCIRWQAFMSPGLP